MHKQFSFAHIKVNNIDSARRAIDRLTSLWYRVRDKSAIIDELRFCYPYDSYIRISKDNTVYGCRVNVENKRHTSFISREFHFNELFWEDKGPLRDKEITVKDGEGSIYFKMKATEFFKDKKNIKDIDSNKELLEWYLKNVSKYLDIMNRIYQEWESLKNRLDTSLLENNVSDVKEVLTKISEMSPILKVIMKWLPDEKTLDQFNTFLK